MKYIALDPIRDYLDDWIEELKKTKSYFRIGIVRAIRNKLDSVKTIEVNEWHNLRKDKKDLPTKEGRYDVIFKLHKDREVQREYSDYKIKFGFTRMPVECVIAWREIDEYKE